MINAKCAICNIQDYKVLYNANFSKDNLNDKTFSARRLPDKIHCRIVVCNNCGLVYSNPRLETKKIASLYKKSNYTYEQYEDDLIATYSKYLKQNLKYLESTNRLLDIGCGNGFFLRHAKSLGFKVTWGVEPSVDTVKKADKKLRKYIISDIFKNGQFKENYFDIICLFQIFDHVAQPNSFLKECYRILRKGGGILCINHNISSFSAKILKDKSPIIDIVHTYLFNKQTLPLIYEKNGFTVINIFEVFNRYPVNYWLRMIPISMEVRNNLLNIATTIGISNKKIWLPPGNIGIFAVKTR